MRKNVVDEVFLSPAKASDKAGVLGLVKAWPTHFIPAASQFIEADFDQYNTLVAIEGDQIIGLDRKSVV